MSNKEKTSILSEGIELYNKGDYTSALTFFISLPENSNCDNIELAYYIGLCYARLERYDDALLYLEQVVTAEKESPRVFQCRYLLAVIYAMTGKKRLADFELNKLLETGYRPASVYSSLAYIAWQQKEIEKCIEYYKKALDYEPENVTALNGMGYVLACEEKDLTKALSYCKKALDRQPNSAACLDSAGWIYFKLGLKEDAQKYLLQAYSLKPQNEEILEHLKIAQVEIK
ncbi:tetratricopeptide repeat protein [Treponema pectinovorum]|uniref:tetratricopeptide repeat protein n=1 Tax=Treponema pectinovorum TaxID=164 RepID=UPI0011CB7F85|nr:tetratricopeptide repeat protein [Treponema pectinovorum]